MTTPTIKVAAGHYVNLEYPTVDMFDLDTICQALAKLCRFGGHCPRFYSVAEHSYHAGVLAKADGLPRETVLAVLLHDAAEAYIGDIVRPLKMLLPTVEKIENRILRKIEAALGVDFKYPHLPHIHKYDLQMLKAEKTEWWGTDTDGWGLDAVELRRVEFQYWCPDTAARRFKTHLEHYF